MSEMEQTTLYKIFNYSIVNLSLVQMKLKSGLGIAVQNIRKLIQCVPVGPELKRQLLFLHNL